MRKLAISLLTCGLVGVASAEVRTFTSADGSKTLQASVRDYSPKKGTTTIKLATGRVMTIPVKSLSAADKTFLDGWYTATQAGRNLHVSIRDEEKQMGERTANNGKIKTINARYALNVRNNAAANFDNIEIKYRVFYYKDGVDGKKNQYLTLDGQDSITTISAREDQRIMTDSVNLTKVRPLPASQCKGGT